MRTPSPAAARAASIACASRSSPSVEKHQDLLIGRLVVQRGARHFDRAADVGAAARDDRRVDGVERLREHVAIERQRALQERVAGKRHQPDAIALELRDQIGDGELGARQPIGLQVGRAHALRRVDGEQEVDAASLRLFPAIAALRPRQRRARRQQADDDERPLDDAPRPRQRRRSRRYAASRTRPAPRAAADRAARRAASSVVAASSPTSSQ